MQTREQHYAKTVLECVQACKKLQASDQNVYGSMSHQLPILIRTAGLAQALAFVDSRDVKILKTLLDDIAQTVGLNRLTLLQRSREAELSAYMHLTQQVLTALLWFKRFAQSVLDVQTPDSDALQAERGTV